MWSDNRDCPCTRDCPDRVPACHASCPKYKEWRAMIDIKKKEGTLRQVGRQWTAAQRKSIWKSYRRGYPGAYKKVSG